ncbi:MAG: VOC family protein [Burkholderiaceae bacterium]|nr:MAG: VOC family protein [Burkholderiaceae bacterium]
MPIARLNHAVLYVRDAEKSAAFYCDVLGFTDAFLFPNARFLRAPASTNDHDLALFSIGADAAATQAGHNMVGLYHLAWEVTTLGELRTLRTRLVEAGALYGETNHVRTKSLYARDHDGLELEVMWMAPLELLTAEEINQPHRMTRLDLEREIERFGADTISANCRTPKNS